MRHTVILRSLDADNEPKMLQEYKNIHDQMQEILPKMKPEDSNITFEKFLSKLGTTEEVYILAICSSLQKPKVFLKRDVPYNLYQLLYEKPAVSMAGKP